jgi:hypothetical protein
MHRVALASLQDEPIAPLEALATAACLALTSLARVRHEATGDVIVVLGLTLPCDPCALRDAVLRSTAGPKTLERVLGGLVHELVGHYDGLAEGYALRRLLDAPEPRSRRVSRARPALMRGGGRR